MKNLLVLLLLTSALPINAAILKIESGTIAPFNARGMTILEFVKEYAEVNDVMLSIQNKTKMSRKVNLVTYTPITTDRLDNYLSQVLSGVGLFAHRNQNTIEILEARTSKYLSQHLYTSKNFPSKREIITVLHQLQYPLSGKIQRSLRSQISRFGRIYSLAGESFIMIKDYGNKITSMLAMIEEMDTKEAYNSYVTRIKKRARAKSRANTPEIEKLSKEIKDYKKEIEELKKTSKSSSFKGAKNA